MTIDNGTQSLHEPSEAVQPDLALPARRADRTVRIHTVVWGILLIAVAAVFYSASQFDLGRFNPAVVAVWAVLGIGAIAVIGGLAGAIFRRR